MLGKAETEQLRELCRRYCAVSSDGTAAPGYFRIDGGDGAKRARKVAANIPWGDTEPTASELIRRTGMALTEHRWVFVRAMPAGESHPADTVRLEGSPAPSIDGDDEDSPKGKDSAAEALARVSLAQMRAMEQMMDRNERLHDALQETQLKAGIYQYHAEALALTSKSELASRAIETMGPQLLAQLPQLAAIWAAYQSGQPVPTPATPTQEQPPETPAAAVGWHVDRICASVEGLGQIAQEYPEARQESMPHLMRLRALLIQVAPLVGLQVTPAVTPPPPAQGG